MSEITDAELRFWLEMAARQQMLCELRPTGGDDFKSVARVAMPRLIAEVERLREKCDDLTVNGFRVNLKQLDEAKKEIERLQAEVKRLKEVVAGYCGSGQRIQDLSDDCGLLEESNKTLRAEVERLRAENSRQANELAVMTGVPDENKRLQAEIERLRKKCDDLTINGFRDHLKQLDESRKETERLRALLRAACSDPESQPSIEAWGKLRREFGEKEGGA